MKPNAPSSKPAIPKVKAQEKTKDDETDKQKIVVQENSYAADWEEVTELMEEVQINFCFSSEFFIKIHCK